LHTPVGRIVAGVVLAQGLAYGLQLLCYSGLQAAVDESRQSIWSTLFGLVLLQFLQGFSLLIGGGLAGAGQRRAWLIGGTVGLIHGFLFLMLQSIQRLPITEVALFEQPLLCVAFGALGAILGYAIWRPLPVLELAEVAIDLNGRRFRKPNPGFRALSGPVAWGRVFAGILVVTAGFLWGPGLLNVLLEASQHKLRINDQLQAQLVTWEIIGLLTLLGAAMAGATTPNGLKQGLHVGMGATILLVGNQLGSKSVALEQMLLIGGSIMSLTVAGGWFGGQLFPPIVAGFRSRGY
jgi:hypothetical protein